jgi:hypothetical protein
MVIIKSDDNIEAGIFPDEAFFAEMGAYNEELVNAGVMVAGEGLHPSSKGARVLFNGKTERHVVDGPFAEAKELVAGFWIWQVESLEAAIDWAKRCPNLEGVESEVEIRPIYEMEDFGENLSPELREQEERLRQQIAQQQA